MANYCDNYLEINSIKPISFLETFSKEYPDIYISSILVFEKVQLADDAMLYKIGFTTKWTPPTEYYESLKDNPDIISAYAQWCEPGYGIIGYFRLAEGEADMVDEDYPTVYYSDLLGIDIIDDEPTQTYIDMNGDDYVSYAEYLEAIEEAITKGTITREQADEERKIVSDIFS